MNGRASRGVVFSAWLVPLMVAGQFAMLAVVPLAVAVGGARRTRALRPWAALLAAAYAVPLLLWAVGPDRAPSLSKDMDPALVPVVVAAAVPLILVAHLSRRRRAAA